VRVVIPHAGLGGKTRLEMSPSAREELSRAMLMDVLAAALEVGTTSVVTPDPAAAAAVREAGATVISDPGGGQAAAVEAGLSHVGTGPVLVMNSDLPSLTAADVQALAEAIPRSGIALAAAADGTTNALGLSDATVFAPLYGEDSAARFQAHADRSGLTFVPVNRPGFRDDADDVADLVRLAPRAGPHTRECLARLGLA
jgi:2-phospho-L-lactate/phosphoenolpyruvate guanylyltransferase